MKQTCRRWNLNSRMIFFKLKLFLKLSITPGSMLTCNRACYHFAFCIMFSLTRVTISYEKKINAFIFFTSSRACVCAFVGLTLSPWPWTTFGKDHLRNIHVKLFQNRDAVSGNRIFEVFHSRKTTAPDLHPPPRPSLPSTLPPKVVKKFGRWPTKKRTWEIITWNKVSSFGEDFQRFLNWSHIEKKKQKHTPIHKPGSYESTWFAKFW